MPHILSGVAADPAGADPLRSRRIPIPRTDLHACGRVCAPPQLRAPSASSSAHPQPGCTPDCCTRYVSRPSTCTCRRRRACTRSPRYSRSGGTPLALARSSQSNPSQLARDPDRHYRCARGKSQHKAAHPRPAFFAAFLATAQRFFCAAAIRARIAPSRTGFFSDGFFAATFFGFSAIASALPLRTAFTSIPSQLATFSMRSGFFPDCTP